MNRSLIVACGLAVAALLTTAPGIHAGEPVVIWVKSGEVLAPEARQAAAADEDFLYAVDNRVVAKYDRKTGEKIAASTGPALHLNSGFLHEGRLYCAHSNYPTKPERSEIKVVDLESMELTTFHSFETSPHGSLTVALFERDAWWCVFAKYGSENSQTRLVKFDSAWKELGSWTFPESVISDLGSHSISGGIWRGGQLLATGHGKRVIYVLELPKAGTALNHLGTATSPFPGQGIASDPVTGGLVGINRKETKIILAMPAQ